MMLSRRGSMVEGNSPKTGMPWYWSNGDRGLDELSGRWFQGKTRE